jgi:hypothetical protein
MAGEALQRYENASIMQVLPDKKPETAPLDSKPVDFELFRIPGVLRLAFAPMGVMPNVKIEDSRSL